MVVDAGVEPANTRLSAERLPDWPIHLLDNHNIHHVPFATVRH